MKACLGCGVVQPASRCPTCQRAHKSKYGGQHQTDRKNWQPIVDTGTVNCWRCQQPIDAAWDLGHRPGQPSHPEHELCNRRAGGERT